MEILWRNCTVTFQVVSASDFRWPFANNIVAGQLSSPQKFARKGTRTSEQAAVGQRRQKGIAKILGVVTGLTDLGCGQGPGSEVCSHPIDLAE